MRIEKILPKKWTTYQKKKHNICDSKYKSINNIITKILTYRSSHNKNSKTIANILEAKLVEAGIDRTRYHCGDLEGTSIIRLFQNANIIFK